MCSLLYICSSAVVFECLLCPPWRFGWIMLCVVRKVYKCVLMCSSTNLLSVHKLFLGLKLSISECGF